MYKIVFFLKILKKYYLLNVRHLNNYKRRGKIRKVSVSVPAYIRKGLTIDASWFISLFDLEFNITFFNRNYFKIVKYN